MLATLDFPMFKKGRGYFSYPPPILNNLNL